jgi:hypothetical protein
MDLYPNVNPLADAPDEQDKSLREEKTKALASMPLLPDLIERIEARIKERDSIDALPINERTTDGEFRTMLLANQQLKQILIEEKEFFESIREAYEQ